jgi:hypothetical protein
MDYTATLPANAGLYRHRWSDARGTLREQVLFVGYINPCAPRWQGDKPSATQPLKCCRPDEYLHADRLTPAEWGGWWAPLQEQR